MSRARIAACSPRRVVRIARSRATRWASDVVPLPRTDSACDTRCIRVLAFPLPADRAGSAFFRAFRSYPLDTPN